MAESNAATRPTAGPRTEVAPLWRIRDVATYLGVPVATLYQWRHTGTGPKAYRLGKHLRYRQADVESWLADRIA
ncbi:helix-turn-helix transcriptional regulator [Aquipuribacter hungaricus]|uniref:Helix-turn-helix transcriptional regulator n=1 Tax=Aquipuribacter hungaricus TaxID=545624 RepID=A0ABV7WJY5_9MICO